MRYAFKANKENLKNDHSVIDSCEALIAAESWDVFMESSPYAEKIRQFVKDDGEKMKRNAIRCCSLKLLIYDYMLFQRLAFHSKSDLWSHF